MYVLIQVCAYVCVHSSMCVWESVYVCVCLYVCVCVCVCVLEEGSPEPICLSMGSVSRWLLGNLFPGTRRPEHSRDLSLPDFAPQKKERKKRKEPSCVSVVMD